MLTFSEFKNILQLIASDDSECRILGQELAKQHEFNQRHYNDAQFNDCIYLNGHYIVFKDHVQSLFGTDYEHMSYEQAYEKYITSPHTRGIY